MTDFEGNVVVVTGASRGIGKEIALEFAKRGATLVCVATTAGGLASTVDEIKASGGSAFAYGCDVSKGEEVGALYQAILDHHGTPAVLVNNAGLARDALLLRMSEEDWDRVQDVNLKAVFLMIKGAARPMMKARYGRIVNLSSVIGLGGGSGQANYAAAKAGLVGLTKSVAKELGGRNITCNAVAPGFIETDMTVDLPGEFREFVTKMAPAGRLGKPADIAAAVLFLASEEAAYITGQVLVVDGGLTL